MKLLVPVDGSEPALRALGHALALARSAPNGSLHLVTVHDDLIPLPDLGLVYTPHETRVALQEEECAAVLRAAAEQLKGASVPHTSEVLTGPAAPTIAARADALGCDGIVMGTRGMGAVGNLLLGSVATKVIHAANVPVTLVK